MSDNFLTPSIKSTRAKSTVAITGKNASSETTNRLETFTKILDEGDDINGTVTAKKDYSTGEKRRASLYNTSKTAIIAPAKF